MKTVRFVIIFLFAATAGNGKAGPIEMLTSLKSRNSHLFIYKARPVFKGAVVEVYYSNGDLVTSQRLHRRKLIIDFSDVKPGAYRIEVKKGNVTQDFQFIKM